MPSAVATPADAGLSMSVDFVLGVCSHTLGIGEAVVRRTAVVLWLLIPFESTFIAKSMSKTLLGKGKLVLSPWERK